MSKISPRVGVVDWSQITIEELKEYKMEIGTAKHGNPVEAAFVEVLMDYTRKMGEFLVAMGTGDHRDTLEAVADISNVGDILFDKVQNEYIKSLSEEGPECFGEDDVFDTLECRTKICAWREDCGTIVEAAQAKQLRDITLGVKAISRRDEHSTLME